MTSDKLFINEALVVACTADKASTISSPLSVSSSSPDGARHVIPDWVVPCCSAKPGPTGISAAAMNILFIMIGVELDNILHADGAIGDAEFPNPLAD
jgi:hypothetical protein